MRYFEVAAILDNSLISAPASPFGLALARRREPPPRSCAIKLAYVAFAATQSFSRTPLLHSANRAALLPHASSLPRLYQMTLAPRRLAHPASRDSACVGLDRFRFSYINPFDVGGEGIDWC